MSSEEDRWHVRFAPGEVKLLTLEQIDDLFRLDMIDEDTLLRQDGTEQWLPLRVVAGLDEEEAAPAPVARSAPPPPSSRSAPPPPSSRSAPPPPVRSAPPPPPAPPPVRSAPPPPPAPLPAPASERAPFSPSPSFIPPAPVARSAPPSPSYTPAPPSYRPPPPSVPAPSFAPPAISLAAPVSIAPPLSPPRASRAEPLLIALVAVLGLLVTLHRNGVLASLFASAGQATAYERLEAALGGPGFGTPRALDALVAKTPALTGSTPPNSAQRPR
jgi:hypothetical protein